MSSISSVATSGLNFSGLASGVDTSKIVDGLLALDRARVQNLQNQQSALGQKQETFQGLRDDLLDLQLQAAKLGRSLNGPFDGRKATSSDPSVVAAASS